MVNSTFGENIPKQCVLMAIVLWHEGQKTLALTVDPEGKFMARRFKKAPKEWLGKLTGVDVPPGEYRVQVDKPTFRRLGNMAIDEAIRTAEALGGTSGRSRSRASGIKKSRSSSKASVAAISQVQRSAQAAGRQKAQAQDARQDARKLRELQKAVGQSAARAQSAARVQQAQAIRAQVQKQQAVQRAQREVSAQSRQK